jgi:hypothetical protein
MASAQQRWWVAVGVLVLVLLVEVAYARVKRRYLRSKYSATEHYPAVSTAVGQMQGGNDVVLQPPTKNARLGERRIPTVVDTGRLATGTQLPIAECSKAGRATCWLFGKESWHGLLLVDRDAEVLRWVFGYVYLAQYYYQ